MLPVLLAVMLAGCGGGGGASGPAASTSVGPTATPPASRPTATPSATTSHRPPHPTASPSPSARPTRTPTPTPTPSCVQRRVDSLSARRLAGQLLLMGVDTGGLSAEASQVLRSRDVGSAFLVGNSTVGVQAIRRLTDAVRASSDAHTSMLVAADQEGGLVQRLQGPGFDRIPSAADQAQLSPSALRADATQWGRQLASAGVDVDLAPVADVVPAWLGSGNAPIGALHRGYGSDPSMVAQHVLAFAQGMRAAGRGATVKHFPGLGQVRGNTDFSGDVVDDQTSRHDHYLQPFAAAVKAGVPMVMVSLATYSRIDPKRRAVFSPTVISGMLRGDLGFDGVVVSDDLGAAAEVASVPAGKRALDFLDAGGDLITVTSPSVAADMSAAIVHAMGTDPQFGAAVRAKATRVLELKHQLGLLHCG